MQSARRDLQSLASRIFKEAPNEEAVLLAWPLACGSAVAERTRAINFQDGVLRVQVPDRGWQSQLEAFSAHYCHKISELLGVKVDRISYEVPYRARPAR
ncbi:MAG TPA: DciA family protein [Terriglobales bacterium]|nr:DciA family protein [Terriglobales bacterium]